MGNFHTVEDSPPLAAGSFNINVEISDMKVSDNRGVSLVTHSLGSCIGLAVYDPVAKACIKYLSMSIDHGDKTNAIKALRYFVGRGNTKIMGGTVQVNVASTVLDFLQKCKRGATYEQGGIAVQTTVLLRR